MNVLPPFEPHIRPIGSLSSSFAQSILGKYGFSHDQYLGLLRLVFRELELLESDGDREELKELAAQLRVEIEQVERQISATNQAVRALPGSGAIHLHTLKTHIINQFRVLKQEVMRQVTLDRRSARSMVDRAEHRSRLIEVKRTLQALLQQTSLQGRAAQAPFGMPNPAHLSDTRQAIPAVDAHLQHVEQIDLSRDTGSSRSEATLQHLRTAADQGLAWERPVLDVLQAVKRQHPHLTDLRPFATYLTNQIRLHRRQAGHLTITDLLGHQPSQSRKLVDKRHYLHLMLNQQVLEELRRSRSQTGFDLDFVEAERLERSLGGLDAVDRTAVRRQPERIEFEQIEEADLIRVRHLADEFGLHNLMQVGRLIDRYSMTPLIGLKRVIQQVSSSELAEIPSLVHSLQEHDHTSIKLLLKELSAVDRASLDRLLVALQTTDVVRVSQLVRSVDRADLVRLSRLISELRTTSLGEAHHLIDELRTADLSGLDRLITTLKTIDRTHLTQLLHTLSAQAPQALEIGELRSLAQTLDKVDLSTATQLADGRSGSGLQRTSELLHTIRSVDFNRASGWIDAISRVDHQAHSGWSGAQVVTDMIKLRSWVDMLVSNELTTTANLIDVVTDVDQNRVTNVVNMLVATDQAEDFLSADIVFADKQVASPSIEGILDAKNVLQQLQEFSPTAVHRITALLAELRATQVGRLTDALERLGADALIRTTTVFDSLQSTEFASTVEMIDKLIATDRSKVSNLIKRLDTQSLANATKLIETIQTADIEDAANLISQLNRSEIKSATHLIEALQSAEVSEMTKLIHTCTTTNVTKAMNLIETLTHTDWNKATDSIELLSMKELSQVSEFIAELVATDVHDITKLISNLSVRQVNQAVNLISTLSSTDVAKVTKLITTSSYTDFMKSIEIIDRLNERNTARSSQLLRLLEMSDQEQRADWMQVENIADSRHAIEGIGARSAIARLNAFHAESRIGSAEIATAARQISRMYAARPFASSRIEPTALAPAVSFQELIEATKLIYDLRTSSSESFARLRGFDPAQIGNAAKLLAVFASFEAKQIDRLTGALRDADVTTVTRLINSTSIKTVQDVTEILHGLNAEQVERVTQLIHELRRTSITLATDVQSANQSELHHLAERSLASKAERPMPLERAEAFKLIDAAVTASGGAEKLLRSTNLSTAITEQINDFLSRQMTSTTLLTDWQAIVGEVDRAELQQAMKALQSGDWNDQLVAVNRAGRLQATKAGQSGDWSDKFVAVNRAGLQQVMKALQAGDWSDQLVTVNRAGLQQVMKALQTGDWSDKFAAVNRAGLQQAMKALQTGDWSDQLVSVNRAGLQQAMKALQSGDWSNQLVSVNRAGLQQVMKALQAGDWSDQLVSVNRAGLQQVMKALQAGDWNDKLVAVNRAGLLQATKALQTGDWSDQLVSVNRAGLQQVMKALRAGDWSDQLVSVNRAGLQQVMKTLQVGDWNDKLVAVNRAGLLQATKALQTGDWSDKFAAENRADLPQARRAERSMDRRGAADRASRERERSKALLSSSMIQLADRFGRRQTAETSVLQDRSPQRQNADHFGAQQGLIGASDLVNRLSTLGIVEHAGRQEAKEIALWTDRITKLTSADRTSLHRVKSMTLMTDMTSAIRSADLTNSGQLQKRAGVDRHAPERMIAERSVHGMADRTYEPYEPLLIRRQHADQAGKGVRPFLSGDSPIDAPRGGADAERRTIQRADSFTGYEEELPFTLHRSTWTSQNSFTADDQANIEYRKPPSAEQVTTAIQQSEPVQPAFEEQELKQGNLLANIDLESLVDHLYQELEKKIEFERSIRGL